MPVFCDRIETKIREARIAMFLNEKHKSDWENSLKWAKAKVNKAVRKKKKLQERQREHREIVEREKAKNKKKRKNDSADDGAESESEDESFYTMIDPALELEEDD